MPWTAAHQAPLSMGSSRQEHWSRLPFPPPGDFPKPGIEPEPPASPTLGGRLSATAPQQHTRQYLWAMPTGYTHRLIHSSQWHGNHWPPPPGTRGSRGSQTSHLPRAPYTHTHTHTHTHTRTRTHTHTHTHSDKGILKSTHLLTLVHLWFSHLDPKSTCRTGDSFWII